MMVLTMKARSEEEGTCPGLESLVGITSREEAWWRHWTLRHASDYILARC